MAEDQPVSDGVIATPGFVVWLTGLPSSGKSTLANKIRHYLAESGTRVLILDSDELRQVLTPNPTYSDEERDWFYGVIVHLASWLSRNGENVLIAATAQRQAYRDAARRQVARFVEVYVYCSLEACQRRDTKGIYALAMADEAPNVPGVGSTYEEPAQPEVVVDTERLTPDEAANRVVTYLAHQSYIPLSSLP